MPLPKTILKFKNDKFQEKIAFVVYYDSECILKPTDEKNFIQKHELSSVGLYLKCSYDDELSEYRDYLRPNAAEWFAKTLLEFVDKVEKCYKKYVTLNIDTKTHKRMLKESKVCWICKKLFQDGDIKVVDDSHSNSVYAIEFAI